MPCSLLSLEETSTGLHNVTSFSFLRAEPPFMNIRGTRVLGMIRRGITGSGIKLLKSSVEMSCTALHNVKNGLAFFSPYMRAKSNIPL